MANIKVSEMATATTFENDDYVMIVQNNKNKKITRQNILENIEDDISDLNALSIENSTKINNLSTYSTNEQVIGIWIDGKPIYRKVYQGTTSSTDGGNATISSGITNLDTIIRMEGYIKNDALWWSINADFQSPNYYSSCHYTYNDNLINIKVGARLVSSPVFVILEYTKTTD